MSQQGLEPEERTREALRFIVERSDGKLGRTRLAKLMYLADLEARRYLGRPISGLAWKRDDFGPFDANGFYSALQHLTQSGTIHETVVEGPTLPGRGYHYSSVVQPHEQRLSRAELAVLSFILDQYGELPRHSLVEDIVYETNPFKAVKDQHDVEIPMSTVDNEMRVRLGGVSLEELLTGEEEIRCGRTVSLDDLRRGLESHRGRDRSSTSPC